MFWLSLLRTPLTRLPKSLLTLSSFRIVEVISFIETTYTVHVPDEEVNPDNFRNVNAIAMLIEKLL